MCTDFATNYNSDIGTCVSSIKQSKTNYVSECIKIENIIGCILRGTDLNSIYVMSTFRQYFLKYRENVYIALDNCLVEYFNSWYHVIDTSLCEKSDNTNYVSFMNENIVSMIDKLVIIKKIMMSIDRQVNKYHSLSEYIFVNDMVEILLNRPLSNGKIILQELDTNLNERDLNCFNSICSMIDMLLKYWGENQTEIAKMCNCLGNTYQLFLRKLTLLPRKNVEILWYLFEHDVEFIIKYKNNLESRLEKISNLKELDTEKHMISYIDDTPINSKYIDAMNTMINDIELSILYTNVINNVNFVKRDTLDKVPKHNTIDLSKDIQKFNKDYLQLDDNNICKVTIKTKNAWNVKPVERECIISDELIAYHLIVQTFNRIHKPMNQFNIDGTTSTCIVKITINDNDYEMLLTLEQASMLRVVHEYKQIDINKLLTLCNDLPRDYILGILDGFCSCNLLKNENDIYSFNQNFFETNSKLSFLELARKIDMMDMFDEEVVVSIMDMLVGNSLTVQQVVKKYEEEYGMTNYELINSIIEYLFKNSIVCKTDEVFTINTTMMESMKRLIY